MSARCGANAVAVGEEVCPFAPTHEVVLQLPAGHRYGLPHHPSELTTYTCAVHLDPILHTAATMGIDPDVARIPQPLQ